MQLPIESFVALADNELEGGGLVRNFQPRGEGQIRFAKTQKYIIFLMGGNDSGKTFCGMMKAAHHIIPEKDIHGNYTGFTIHPHRRIRIPTNGLEGWISTYSEKTQISNIRAQYERILEPYELSCVKEAGARRFANFDKRGKIFFKWQTRGKKDYEGDKMNFIFADEPHKKELLKESIARLINRKGTLWNCATLVTDEDTPDIGMADIQWLQEEIIQEVLDNPKKHPFHDVIYARTEDNPFSNYEWAKEAFSLGYSESERRVRLTGQLIGYSRTCLFDQSILMRVAEYLRKNPEIATPEYGTLHSDVEEPAPEDIYFMPSVMQEFPDKPRGDWILKIWEHPLSRNQLDRPRYFIGCDSSEGASGGDYTTAYVKKKSGQVVAALYGHITEIELARQLWLLGYYYADREGRPAHLAIEVNIGAGNVTQTFLLTGHRELGILKYEAIRIYKRPEERDLERGYYRLGTKPGWYTSPRTRRYLLANMRKSIGATYDAIEHGDPPLIPDRLLFEEARRFKLQSDGRKYAATPGVSNDDCLFASALADEAIKQGAFVTPKYEYEPLKKEKMPTMYYDPFDKNSNTIILNIDDKLKELDNRKQESVMRKRMANRR